MFNQTLNVILLLLAVALVTLWVLTASSLLVQSLFLLWRVGPRLEPRGFVRPAGVLS